MSDRMTLTIGWLYPDLMSTYGDRGNILVLQRLANWQNIDLEIMPISQHTTIKEIKKVDLVFGGGSQDLQQDIVMKDLLGKKGDTIKELIEDNVPALFVCGSPQLMGKFYEPALGKRIPGLGIFDMETVNPGINVDRCIGNIVAIVEWLNGLTIVGFENHGGRTYLGKSVQPFAKVIKGYGNNGKDGTEGVKYKNAIGCYFHGPLLPKNPLISKYLLEKAIEVKYQEKIPLSISDNILSEKAKNTIFQRLNIQE